MMSRLGLLGSVIAAVNDIYSHSTIAVRTGRDSYTQPIPQFRGVKQVCPLSPILFNIALEGLRHLTSHKAGYAMAGCTINSLAYADDVCIVATKKSDMQSLLDRCVAFAEWAGLTFNAKKCGSLCMLNRQSPIPLFSPHLGADTIPALSWE